LLATPVMHGVFDVSILSPMSSAISSEISESLEPESVNACGIVIDATLQHIVATSSGSLASIKLISYLGSGQ
ncbi:5284_t:CDS:1, partial [Paraglomus occultum]